MTKIFPSLLVLLLLAGPARATELTDLGQGLGYLRIHSAADSEKALRSAVAGAGALVLDLRHVSADEASAAALRAGLAAHATSAPLFVLIGPDTPAVLTAALASAPSSVLTLGLAGTQPAPKVVVRAEAAADRLAFDALDAGTPVATLINTKVEKERFDEASLMEEFKNGNPDAAPPPAADPTEAKADAAETKPAPLVDRVLQRAVHLHRALLALRK
jgi:hypothetical protein